MIYAKYEYLWVKNTRYVNGHWSGRKQILSHSLYYHQELINTSEPFLPSSSFSIPARAIHYTAVFSLAGGDYSYEF